jgi:L-ribulose-5-phosphate 3-epimerase
MTDLSRGEFLKLTPLLTMFNQGRVFAKDSITTKTLPSVCMFSKHLSFLDYKHLGVALKQIGFDGVDLTVRPKGHVLPENVEHDLPLAAEIIRAEGIDLPMITTNLTSPDDPTALPTLRTAADLGIPYYKLGYYYYDDLGRLDVTLAHVKKSVEGLAALGSHVGIQGGFHTHNGRTVGSAMWDNWWIQRDLDLPSMGFYFDPCHATIEGGNWGWKIGFHRLASRINIVSLKDFYWEKRSGKWRVRYCPMGEGMVRFDEFFKMLSLISFHGPISVHLEYEINGSTESARQNNTLTAIEKDLRFVQDKLTQAYRISDSRP